MKLLTALFILIAVFWVPVAEAQTVAKTVTGRFRPNALDPNNTEFENTTPRGAFCNWRPTECQRRDAYIFDLGNREYWRKSGDGDNSSRRNTTYIGFPAPRLVTFTNTQNGHTFQASVSFVAMSLRLDFTRGQDPWYYGISGGCTAIRGAGGVGFSTGGWGVRDPQNPQACYSTVARGDRTYVYRNVGIGIDVRLPSAMTLQEGRYTASPAWEIGTGPNHIDLGDNITGIRYIRLDFEFDVIHDFQLRFPSEHPRVTLAPDGGWGRWVDHGITPATLRQELPFYLTSSMDFSLKMRCEHEVDRRCGIRHADSDTVVPVDVDVTIPGMRNLKDGKPAQFSAMVPDDTLAPRFTPEGYVRDRRSVLRFIANRDAVEKMVDRPSSHWEGNMTLVFDANP
ncbi:hypothetical protein [Stenotrophomonas maltophilia]|uniref:hypothetical protein n=1 Tax=Stenotrophomonas maltophilia TaxID=40324 RepID=UPI0039F721E5